MQEEEELVDDEDEEREGLGQTLTVFSIVHKPSHDCWCYPSRLKSKINESEPKVASR